MIGTQPGVLVRETHSGFVLLVGEHAYKLKKPVDLGFLDFRDMTARRAACRREIELNRRLSPDVYLGLGDFTGPDSEDGEPVIVMRRMPDELRLAELARAGADLGDEIGRLARLLADFHARADRNAAVSREGSAARLWARWHANLTEAARYCPAVLAPDVLARVHRLALRYIDGRGPLLAGRVAAGNVVDGHGDLIAEDIFCLPDGPRVLDCLEFDDRLRSVDVLDDLAFLAMDLEYLGRPDLAAALLATYKRFSATRIVPTLLDHYIAYRAFVRAKVSAIRADQGYESAAIEARRHATLAVEHLRAGEVKLVLVGGAPATGKTTIGGRIADDLDYALISSDVVRRELSAAGPDRYSDTAKDATYAELLRRARRALVHGQSVVADATWDTGKRRRRAAAVAAETASTLVTLECVAPIDVAVERAARRARRERSASEAGPDVVRTLAATREAWPGAVRVATDRDPAAVVADALAAVRSVSFAEPCATRRSARDSIGPSPLWSHGGSAVS